MAEEIFYDNNMWDFSDRNDGLRNIKKSLEIFLYYTWDNILKDIVEPILYFIYSFWLSLSNYILKQI